MKDNGRILIRADSSSSIGTGHIMRDLVLAKQFEGSEIIFATQKLPGNINHKIVEAKFKVESLDSNNLTEVVALVKKYSIDMVVIDNYEIDYLYEEELKNETGVQIFVVDDTYEKHCCDILLNHNVSADSARYRSLVPQHCYIKCGSKYTLLREEFRNVNKKHRNIFGKDTLTVFVAMGGADHSNKNIHILKAINHFDNVNVKIVTTRANKHLGQLQKVAEDFGNVSVYVNSDRMASLMNDSDFAIVTPSVTVNEVLHMGLPFIAIQTADNQCEIANYLKRNGFQVLNAFDSDMLIGEIHEMMIVENYNTALKNIDAVLGAE